MLHLTKLVYVVVYLYGSHLLYQKLCSFCIYKIITCMIVYIYYIVYYNYLFERLLGVLIDEWMSMVFRYYGPPDPIKWGCWSTRKEVLSLLRAYVRADLWQDPRRSQIRRGVASEMDKEGLEMSTRDQMWTNKRGWQGHSIDTHASHTWPTDTAQHSHPVRGWSAFQSVYWIRVHVRVIPWRPITLEH